MKCVFTYENRVFSGNKTLDKHLGASPKIILCLILPHVSFFLPLYTKIINRCFNQLIKKGFGLADADAMAWRFRMDTLCHWYITTHTYGCTSQKTEYVNLPPTLNQCRRCKCPYICNGKVGFLSITFWLLVSDHRFIG